MHIPRDLAIGGLSSEAFLFPKQWRYSLLHFGKQRAAHWQGELAPPGVEKSEGLLLGVGGSHQ